MTFGPVVSGVNVPEVMACARCHLPGAKVARTCSLSLLTLLRWHDGTARQVLFHALSGWPTPFPAGAFWTVRACV